MSFNYGVKNQADKSYRFLGPVVLNLYTSIYTNRITNMQYTINFIKIFKTSFFQTDVDIEENSPNLRLVSNPVLARNAEHCTSFL